jgi:hypothetical protein
MRAVLRVVALLFLLPWMLAQAGLAHAGEFDHRTWDSLARDHVVPIDGGRITQVDYAGFKADQVALGRYLASTAAITRATFDTWSLPEQLAFLVNVYNARTVELVLSDYPDLASIKDLGSLLQSPWKIRFIPLLGETRSLDDIEHDLIRGSGRYGDPRIHFAVNCASVGCPALRPEAYRAERLDEQLEDAARSFLSDRGRNRFDGDVLRVSSIFKWYRQDFEAGWRGARSLGTFLALYRQSLGLDAQVAERLEAGDVDIEFLDYDWSLNALRRGGS